MAFAAHSDVQTRLGRDLTADEQDTATAVIATVEGLIVEVSGEAAPSTAPAYYKALCVEKAIGAITNPENVASRSESLGAHSHSQTFPRDLDSGIFLTEREEYVIRRIANNAVSGSSRPHSLIHDTYVAEED